MDITSRANPRVAEAIKLKSKKERDEKGLFVFEGIKLFREAVRRGASLCEVFVTEKARAVLENELDIPGCRVYTVSDGVYEKLTDDRAPDGVFCTARFLRDLHTDAARDPGKAFILCDVQDAGNLGTCLRSALAFGIETLILCGECADVYNPKCVRSSVGAVFSQKTLRIPDPSGAIDLCRAYGRKVYAAALRDGAVPLDSIGPDADIVFAVGNEGHGLSADFISRCDGCAVIPMQGGTESLNAAVASSILMWHMRNN